MTLAHLPKLSARDLGVIRSPGPGLGNLLFPISRALVGKLKYGGNFVFPTMRQVKIGTILRRENDLRTYGDVLRCRTAAEWQSWVSARRQRTVTELDFEGGNEDVTVVYEGLGNYFHDFSGSRSMIRGWIVDNARAQAPKSPPYDIAVHVRLGDFLSAQSADDSSYVRQPFDWYRSAVSFAADRLRLTNPRVCVFTDGDPKEVERGLGVPNLTFDDSANALQSILRIAECRMLVASRSTFSMWGTFLGDTAAVWDRRFDIGPFFPLRSERDHQI